MAIKGWTTKESDAFAAILNTRRTAPMTGFAKGDVVRHLTDPHGRSRGTVESPPDRHGIVRVRWFGVGEPDDWHESVHETEIRLRHPKGVGS